MGSRSATLPPDKTSDKLVRQQLGRILASKTFLQVERLKRFINFIVGEMIEGRGGDLKEYVIGVQVFGKESSFDPRTDPIVRVQARRLRTRLARYYRDEGSGDELIVDLPKGGYAPVFRKREGAPPARPSLSAALVNRNTVSVTMFADRSPGSSLEYFCHGLRDEIVHGLTAIRQLRVLSTPAQSGDQPSSHDAALVISGSVRLAGERVRVTTRLEDGTSRHYLWSESVDLPLADPVGAQEVVAKAVINRLQAEILESPSSADGRRSNENLAARNLHMQGRYHLNQRTEEGLQKAVEFFERAVGEDAQFALAHSGLADAYGLLAHYGVLGPADVWARAASSAASAVMLDGHSAEAHTSLAHVRATQDWDWAGAEREYLQAIQLNRRYPTAHHWYAMSCLVPMGRLDDALEQMHFAQSLDPVSSIIARDVAVVFCYRRDFDAALEHCDQTIELNPHFAAAYLTLGLIQEQRKDFDEAEAAFSRAVELAPLSPRANAALARTFALAGKHDSARAVLRQLDQQAATRYVSPFEYVAVHFALGDDEEGFARLAKSCDDRCFELLALKVDPRFENLRDDPRFVSALKRIGLD
jgi:TolB-like protein/Flp pilus assembly protein TadD